MPTGADFLCAGDQRRERARVCPRVENLIELAVSTTKGALIAFQRFFAETLAGAGPHDVIRPESAHPETTRRHPQPVPGRHRPWSVVVAVEVFLR